MKVFTKDLGPEISRFKEPEFQPETAKHYSTGFKELDDYLAGGFTKGFHTLAGKPSQGKTTFLLQLAENIGKTGTHVLYFSTETLAETMSASSISRASFKLDPQSALSTEEVLKAVDGHPDSLPPDLTEAIDRSASDCENVTVIDCAGWNHSVEEIKETVSDYIHDHGDDVFVIVDYLQELMPTDGKTYENRKALVDHNVITLKLMSQSLQIPVLLVCAINRENYAGEVTLDSLKDTGRLEYNLDTILAITTDGPEDVSIRDVTISIIKQRTGALCDVSFYYYARNNCFECKETFSTVKGLNDVLFTGIEETDDSDPVIDY